MMVSTALFAAAARQPHLVVILTDDQDLKLGSMQAMPKLQKLVVDKGVTFEQAFIATPICCPSRSSYISGRFQHNHRCLQNKVSDGCNSAEWRNTTEKDSVAPHVQAQGYTTFYAGKYLNAYGQPQAGGLAHVPPGWDSWLGLQGNSRYYNYSVSRNGTQEKHGDDYGADYFTDLVKNETLRFLRDNLGSGKPLFSWSSPPACHGPNDPAPQYAGRFANESAPRTPNFNTGVDGKNPFNSALYHPPMSESGGVAYADITHRRRLEVLLSVDDLVEAVVNELDAAGELENTILLYTSDHGYHLGQFAMSYDKRTPYEHDVRIPYFVRVGKNLQQGGAAAARLRGSSSSTVVSNVDVAPTMIALASGSEAQVPATMDGASWAGDLGLAAHPPSRASPPAAAKDTQLIEYWGQANNDPSHSPGEFHTPPQFQGSAFSTWQDQTRNTFACLRMVPDSAGVQGDELYCQWFEQYADKVTGNFSFEEHYDIASDPWQLMNTAASLDPQVRAALRARLTKLRNCVGGADCADAATAA